MIPGVLAKKQEIVANPYFLTVMDSLIKKGKPLLGEVPN